LKVVSNEEEKQNQEVGKVEIKLTGNNFKKEILDSDIPALVDFWAPWCGPCNRVAPTVEKIAKEYQGKLKVGKLNVDEAPDVASQYNIMGIPTLMIFKNGKVVEVIVGVEPKEYIEEKINQHMNGQVGNR
jgi:thioredoxin 1